MESRGPPSGDLVGGCCAGCARAAPALARPARCAAAAPIADSFAEVHELASAEANGRPSVLPLAVLPTGLPCSACGTTDTARKEPLGTVGRISFDSDPQASAVVVTKNRRDVASWATRGQGTDTQRNAPTEGSSAYSAYSEYSLTHRQCVACLERISVVPLMHAYGWASLVEPDLKEPRLQSILRHKYPKKAKPYALRSFVRLRTGCRYPVGRTMHNGSQP